MGSIQPFTPKITIISGPRDTGKTRLCLGLVEKIRVAGKEINGIVSPGLYKDNIKVGILARDIRTGEQRQLAEFSPGWDSRNPAREWKFDPQTLEWGNEVLETALPSDYFLVDELGFLELDENKGWIAGLEGLDSGFFNQAYVVIRPELLEIAQKRWPNAQLFTIKAGDDTEGSVEILLSNSTN